MKIEPLLTIHKVDFKQKISWFLLALFILLLDQLTKSWAVSALSFSDPQSFLPFFNFTLLYNYGAAFSLLSDAGGWQRWFFIILAVGVSLALVRWLQTLKDDKWLAIAIALILGGAVGNLYDRITLGYVVDFLHFYWGEYHFPAFNIADTAISIGAGMMIIDIFRNKEEEKTGE